MARRLTASRPTRSRRALALLLVALMVPLMVPLTPLGQAAPPSQEGHDGGRTGAVPFELPETNDTAFVARLSGTPRGTAAIVERTAYVITLDADFDDAPELDANALWAIDLETAEVTRKFDFFDERPSGAAVWTDGSRVYVSVGRDLTAYDLEGTSLWTWRTPESLPGADGAFCYPDPAFVGETMYLACLEFRDAEIDAHTAAMIAAIDVTTGEERWIFEETANRRPGTSLGGAEDAGPSEQWDFVNNIDVAATESRVVFYGPAIGRHRSDTGVSREIVGTVDPDIYAQQYQLFGLDAEDGDFLWYRNDTTRQSLEGRTSQTGGVSLSSTLRVLGGAPVLGPNRVFIRLDAFSALNPTTGQTIWSRVTNAADRADVQGSYGIGLRDDAVFSASLSSITRLRVDTGDPVWQYILDPATKLNFGTLPLYNDEERLYASTFSGARSGGGLLALDIETGEQLWHHDLTNDIGTRGGRYASAAFGDGVIVGPHADGRIDIIGTTKASIGAPKVDAVMYPQPDEPFTVDLSDVDPGLFGPATRYRVEWGDGTLHDWQASPVFTHTYERDRAVTARLTAGNDQNQTASSLVTMKVGERAPNFIETAFMRENQDVTFGILGILVAVSGGFIGIILRYRARSRLHDELEALEAGYEERKDKPADCEAFLATRKARYRSLLAERTLTEDQFSVLARRNDELQRALRGQVLDERFHYLPHGLVRSIHKMLADGSLSMWERDTIDDLLAQDKSLTKRQKEDVRKQLDQWSAEDRPTPSTPTRKDRKHTTK